jgi:hypothetical protein
VDTNDADERAEHGSDDQSPSRRSYIIGSLAGVSAAWLAAH